MRFPSSAVMHFPRVPLKEMDAASLAYELGRESDRIMLGNAEMDASTAREMVTSAAMLATHLHRNQTRRVRRGMPHVPYIEHPLRNALRVVRWGATSPETVAVALLHDTVEDCSKEIVTVYASLHSAVESHGDTIRNRQTDHDVALEWIDSAYGSIVAEAVSLVSNKPGAEPEDYTPKIDALCSRVLNADKNGRVDLPGLIALVNKASDLIDNGGSLKHQIGYAEGAPVLADLQTAQKLAGKYREPVSLVGSALTRVEDPVAQNAAAALSNVAGSLEAILAMPVPRAAAQIAAERAQQRRRFVELGADPTSASATKDAAAEAEGPEL